MAQMTDDARAALERLRDRGLYMTPVTQPSSERAAEFHADLALVAHALDAATRERDRWKQCAVDHYGDCRLGATCDSIGHEETCPAISAAENLSAVHRRAEQAERERDGWRDERMRLAATLAETTTALEAMKRERDEAEQAARHAGEAQQSIRAMNAALTRERDAARAIVAAIQPGLPEAFVAGMFREAERLGHSSFSAKHALTFLTETIAALTLECNRYKLKAEQYHAMFDEKMVGLLTQVNDAIAANATLEKERDQLRAIVPRLALALEQHLPPDPHVIGGGPGHACDAECEEMFHLSDLLRDARMLTPEPAP